MELKCPAPVEIAIRNAGRELEGFDKKCSRVAWAEFWRSLHQALCRAQMRD
jgi:hypothetical protein